MSGVITVSDADAAYVLEVFHGLQMAQQEYDATLKSIARAYLPEDAGARAVVVGTGDELAVEVWPGV